MTEEQHAQLIALPVTLEDIESVQQLVKDAFPVVSRLAEERATKAKIEFTAPGVEYYGLPDEPLPECVEQLKLENAFYCIPSNTLYLDVFWLVQLGKFVEDATAPRKYAILTVFAHEMGHAADYKFNMLIREQRGSLAWGILHELFTESSADCFAGAAVEKIVQDSPEQEKANALSAGMRVIYKVQGDRFDRRYAPGDQRMLDFKGGFEQGQETCFKH